MVGRTLLHYRITAKLGEGGMGEVYLAEDTRLDRRVALKVLPPSLAADSDRLRRFEQEAKTVAALNHPSIVTLYSVEEDGESKFLTMELVEGQTLDQRIPATGLPLTEFFELAIPMADALTAAHDQGIVHRDLKPANVMVTARGGVKVLDFGLAKLTESGASNDETKALTQDGLVMGTVPYMSPEQVQGKPVDHRSDIFSLGILLYEMATGRRPFQGENSASVISAVLRDDPAPITQINNELPNHLGRVVRRCLEKDLERRFQSARDVRNELEGLRAEALSGPRVATEQAEGSGRGTALRWGVPAAAALALVAWLLTRPADNGAAPTSSIITEHLSKLTFAPGLESEPAFSPDGKFIAYTTDENGSLDIVVQPLGGGEPILAVSGPADDAQPAWSPDGTKLAFVSGRDRDGHLTLQVGLGEMSSFVRGSGGELFVAPAFGGPAVKLASDAYYPAWSPDGKRIAFHSSTQGESAIWVVAATGGPLARLSAEETPASILPAWSPDGRWIAYLAVAGELVSLRVMPSEGGPDAVVFELGSPQAWRPAWSPRSDELLFSSDRAGGLNIWRSRFTASPSPSLGAPEPVTVGGGPDIGAAISPADGRLAYASLSLEQNIWEVDLETGATRQLTFETPGEDFPSLSPDGESLLVVSDRGDEIAAWVFDAAGRAVTRLGPVDGSSSGGRWSPDGQEVLYSPSVEGHPVLMRQTVGAADGTTVFSGGFCGSWSPDGRTIVLVEVSDGPGGWITTRDLDSGESRRLIDETNGIFYPSFSADGKWVAFEVVAGTGRDIWRVPATGGAMEKLATGEFEDSHPSWSPTDPDTLVFLRKHENVCLLDLATGAVRVLTDYRPGTVLLDYPAVAPDGRRAVYSLSRSHGDVYVSRAQTP